MRQGLSLQELNQAIVDCRRCPRLVQWRESIAAEKRRAFADQTYWGRPVPNFGDPAAERLIVGLAPAAHGANRTGRMFTGDRSGDWLYAALHRAGVASQPSSTSTGDGLTLSGVLITAVAHCAPPANKLEPGEISNCRSYLEQTLRLRDWKSILCLGSLAWIQVHRVFGQTAPKFGHGHSSALSRGAPESILCVASYHPSQQNTFTGKLTEPMLDSAIQNWLSG